MKLRCAWAWFRSRAWCATVYDLEKAQQKIMSAISEFAAKQQEYNDRMDAALSGLQGDVATLKKMIEDLQNNPGPISPEDQALLDQLQARAESMTTRLEALDAMTPPPPPPEEG